MSDEAPKRRGGFQPGRSGNPAGRRPGSRHKITVLAEKLMAQDAQEIVTAVTSAAKAGDMTAARIVLDRLCPVRKGAPVRFSLPAMTTAADVAQAVSAVLAEVAAGNLTPDEAAQVVAIMEARRRALETTELEARITALELRGPTA